MMRLKPIYFGHARLLFALAFVSLGVGCHKQAADSDAVREAVRQHLVSLGTLNLQAMQMDFTKISVDKDHADAEVAFRPKDGSSSGAAMQVAYQLERRGGNWSVVKSAVGGMIQHPPPGSNPHQIVPPGSVHGDLPNFKDILGGPDSVVPSALPSGQAPVDQARKLPRSQP